jgi:hypothetical protein
VDLSKADGLLHVLYICQTKDITMCWCDLRAHLAKHRQLSGAKSSVSLISHSKSEPKAGFWRQRGPIKCWWTALFPSYGSNKRYYSVLMWAQSPFGYNVRAITNIMYLLHRWLLWLMTTIFMVVACQSSVLWHCLSVALGGSVAYLFLPELQKQDLMGWVMLLLLLDMLISENEISYPAELLR